MVRSSGQVRSPDQLLEFLLKLIAKLFPFVSEDFNRDSVSADPFVEQCLGHSSCPFVGNGDNLGVLCEGVSDGENVLLVLAGCDQRPEQIGMNPLVQFCCLRHWLRQGLRFGSLFRI